MIPPKLPDSSCESEMEQEQVSHQLLFLSLFALNLFCFIQVSISLELINVGFLSINRWDR